MADTLWLCYFLRCVTEIQRVQSDIRAAGKPESKYADVIREKPIRVTARIVVPVRDHPKVRRAGDGGIVVPVWDHFKMSRAMPVVKISRTFF